MKFRGEKVMDHSLYYASLFTWFYHDLQNGLIQTGVQYHCCSLMKKKSNPLDLALWFWTTLALHSHKCSQKTGEGKGRWRRKEGREVLNERCAGGSNAVWRRCWPRWELATKERGGIFSVIGAKRRKMRREGEGIFIPEPLPVMSLIATSSHG